MRNKDRLAIAVNSATDPGVVFNIGNAIVNLSRSVAAGSLNIAAIALCFCVRLASELKKKGVPLPLPRWADRLVDNPGAALATNGIILVASGAVGAASIDTSDLKTALPAGISTSLGLANIFLGAARGLKDGSIKQRVLDGAGQTSIVVGMLLASTDAPIPVKVIFAAAGATGIVCAMRSRQSLGAISPGRLNAVGCFGSAATNPDPVFAVANLIWGFGYLCLDALQNAGGVSEMCGRIRGRIDGGANRKKPPSGPAPIIP